MCTPALRLQTEERLSQREREREQKAKQRAKEERERDRHRQHIYKTMQQKEEEKKQQTLRQFAEKEQALTRVRKQQEAERKMKAEIAVRRGRVFGCVWMCVPVCACVCLRVRVWNLGTVYTHPAVVSTADTDIPRETYTEKKCANNVCLCTWFVWRCVFVFCLISVVVSGARSVAFIIG